MKKVSNDEFIYTIKLKSHKACNLSCSSCVLNNNDLCYSIGCPSDPLHYWESITLIEEIPITNDKTNNEKPNDEKSEYFY